MPDPTLLDNSQVQPPPPFAPLAATGNPTLAPLAQLPPDTQRALVEHGNRLLAMPPPGAPRGTLSQAGGTSAAEPATDLAPMGAPSSSAGDIAAMKPLARPTAAATPLAPTPTANQAERTRLTDPTLQSSKPGWQQIHNPFLRTLAGIGNVAESTFFPRAAMLTPGTDLHHSMLVRQNARENATDEGELNEASKRKLEEAQAENQESIPELKRTQADLAKAKETELERKNQATEDISRTKSEGQINSVLAQHGMKKDETGQIVPQSYEEMSEPLQAVHDLKAAQTEQAQATAALKKAQAENAPAAAKLAQARLDSAAQAHSIALRRLGLSEMQTEGRLFGTHNGQALPGTIQTDEGTPVGSAFQQNVRPTGQERNKADLANSAHTQLQDIKSIVARRPDIFGPAAGRKTDFTVWLGSQDPDAQRFRAARTIAGDHLAGVFGGRSEAALQALDSAIGHFKDNPAAMQAGLDQLDKANSGFQKAGTPRTTGSHAAEEATAVPYTDGGKTYNIPASQEKEFLKDHPGAKKANAR